MSRKKKYWAVAGEHNGQVGVFYNNGAKSWVGFLPVSTVLKARLVAEGIKNGSYIPPDPPPERIPRAWLLRA